MKENESGVKIPSSLAEEEKICSSSYFSMALHQDKLYHFYSNK